MENNLGSFTDILSDEIPDSQPLSLSSNFDNNLQKIQEYPAQQTLPIIRPLKHTGQHGEFRSIEEIDPKYREVFTYPFFNLVQSRVIEDALYSDKSMVVCAPTGSGKTVVFEMAIVQLLMEIEEKKYDRDFKIIYMAPVKALCTERLTEWYSKFTKLGLLCIEVTGDTDVDFNNLKPYRVIITTPEKWDMMTRRWRDHRGLVELIKLFLIDEVHILNDDTRGPVLEAVVSRMKTIESSTQSEYRIEQLQRQYQTSQENSPVVNHPPPRIKFVAVSATVSNPEDVAAWLGNSDKPAVYYKFGDECRPVKLKRVVEGYPCPDGTSIFKFDIILNYKLWPIIQKYHDGKPTLIFCNTRKSVILTAEALSREITISFNPEQRTKLTALASTIKNKKLQSLVLAGVGCHHAGLLFEERMNIETAFRNRDLPILITTTTLAMGVNLPAHLVIIKNTQQYVNGAYQEYSISTVLQMVGRAGRPQFDTEATAVIMTRASDKPRYEALVGGSEPLQSYLHKRLPENLNSEAALGTVKDVAQCVQWLRSTFLYVRAAKDPKRYLGLPNNAPYHLISKKIEELCVRAMNGLASAGLITMDEASCIESTEAGRLMSIFYLDLETMKHIMKIEGTATLEQVLWVVCESHELADMHLRVDERRCLNALNRNSAAATIRFPMKGKISTRQMKLNCVIQAVLGCLPIPDPSINQEAMKVMRIADRVCKCLVAYVTRPDLISGQPVFFSAVLNSLILSKCIAAHLWENSPYVSKQLKGIGPTFSTLLATAGKINFMLLEESHPRDLERIMNKGPPAGNVLRKQISLLPKYQITMTPVDEKVVKMELSLLNHNYLAENMDNLTAGERHKSYIIVGDSENHLLLLTSFQDKDLIGMYDGKITHEINRKHNFEHKITTHCVSSMFVGIDAQCEYVFKDLESAPMHCDRNSCYFNKDVESNKITQRQTYITDVYKERKRKNKCDTSEICQSKEKKKRESVLAEKIRLLKESFGKTTKDVKEELQKSAEISSKIVHDICNLSDKIPVETNNISVEQATKIRDVNHDIVSCDVENHLENVNYENFETNEYIDDSKINDILKDIENEICKEEKNSNHLDNFNSNRYSTVQKVNSFKRPVVKNQKLIAKKPKKSNFSFIELLDKNVDFYEEEVENETTADTGLPNTIKLQIDKYLQETELSTKTNNLQIEKLINNEKSTDLEKMDEGYNNDPLPLVKLNSNKLDEYTCSGSNINNVEFLNEYSNTNTETKEKVELTQSSTLVKPKIFTHTENKSEEMNYDTHNNNNIDILNQSLKGHLRNVSQERTYENNNIQNLNIVSIEESENNSHKYDDDRKLLIKNISHLKTPYPQDIYDKKSAVEEFSKNCDRFLSENVEYKKNDNPNKYRETKDTNCKQNYIRNFKFAATNVDISSRHSANHHVQIIKKIKLDVDVTEIVTNTTTGLPTNTSFANYEKVFTPVSYITRNTRTSDKSASSYQVNDLKNMSYFDKSNAIQNDDNIIKYNIEAVKQNTFSMEKLVANDDKDKKFKSDLDLDITKTMTNGIQLDTHVSYTGHDDIGKLDELGSYYGKKLFSNTQLLESTSNSETLDSYAVQNNNENSNNNIVDNELNNCSTNIGKSSTEVKTNNSHFELKMRKNTDTEQTTEPVFVKNINMSLVPKINKMKNQVEDVKEPIKSDIREETKKENTLGSILQKYSRVFSKNKKEDERVGNTERPQSNSEILKIEHKHKRPFKITDIDKLEQKLPPLLIAEIPKHSTPSQNQTLVSMDKEENKVVSLIPIIETSGETQIEHDDTLIIPETKIEHLSPTPSKDFLQTDYKIDDSMLNPKTLLQCLITDESQLIPPPPEFSDLNYSPPQPAEKYHSDTHESLFEIAELDRENNVFDDDNTKHAYPVSGENKHHNSSNEIETLLLSNEDYIERKPWIIAHSPAFRNTPGGTSYTARRANLNQFKFKNKKKFKIK